MDTSTQIVAGFVSSTGEILTDSTPLLMIFLGLILFFFVMTLTMKAFTKGFKHIFK